MLVAMAGGGAGGHSWPLERGGELRDVWTGWAAGFEILHWLLLHAVRMLESQQR